ncbi:MAG: VOC family protein [Opitutaceae bacterium]
MENFASRPSTHVWWRSSNSRKPARYRKSPPGQIKSENSNRTLPLFAELGTGVAFIFHAVRDIPGARKFYEQFLGLKIGMQVEISPGVWWIEYDVAGVAVGISNARPGKPSLSLVPEVVHLDASLAEACAAGVTVTSEIMTYPSGRMFRFNDPDGNEICLHQRENASRLLSPTGLARMVSAWADLRAFELN